MYHLCFAMPTYGIVASLPKAAHFVLYDSDSGSQDDLGSLEREPRSLRARVDATRRSSESALYATRIAVAARQRFGDVESLAFVVSSGNDAKALTSSLDSALSTYWRVDWHAQCTESRAPHEAINAAIRHLSTWQEDAISVPSSDE